MIENATEARRLTDKANNVSAQRRRVPRLDTILRRITNAAYLGKSEIEFPCKYGYDDEIQTILYILKSKEFQVNYWYGKHEIIVRW